MAAYSVAFAFFFVMQTGDLGTLLGRVDVPRDQPLSSPLQAVLVPPRYADLLTATIQQRLDWQWEAHKPQFVRDPLAFLDVLSNTYRESAVEIMTQIRRDFRDGSNDWIKETSSNGTFQFDRIPPGTYMLFVFGRVDGQERVWFQSIEIKASSNFILELGKPVS
jgi:hypothetical protein